MSHKCMSCDTLIPDGKKFCSPQCELEYYENKKEPDKHLDEKEAYEYAAYTERMTAKGAEERILPIEKWRKQKAKMEKAVKPIAYGNLDADVEEVLRYMGIDKETYGKQFAYRNWVKTVESIKRFSGMDYKMFKNRLRTILGMQDRYTEEYIDSIISWEVAQLSKDCIIYVGIPEKKGD